MNGNMKTADIVGLAVLLIPDRGRSRAYRRKGVELAIVNTSTAAHVCHVVGDDINHEILAEKRIELVTRGGTAPDGDPYHAPGMQRCRELDQIGLGPEGWIHCPNILSPVSMVGRSATP